MNTIKTYGDLVKTLDAVRLFNKAPELDENLFSDIYNGSLELPCYEHNSLDDDCYGDYKEIYQYYLISQNDAEYIARHTDELIVYSDVLDEYVWCIDHFGTSWDYVNLEWKND